MQLEWERGWYATRKAVLPGLAFFGVAAFAVFMLLTDPAARPDSGPRVTRVVTQQDHSQSGRSSAAPTERTTTEQTTTTPPSEPGFLDRLLSERALTLLQLAAALIGAFICAALVQRALLGEFAFKLAGAELAALGEGGNAIDNAALLAEQTVQRSRDSRRLEPADGSAGAGPKHSREVPGAAPVSTASATNLEDLADKLAESLRRLLTPGPATPTPDPAAMAAVLVRRGALDQPLADAVLRIIDVAAGARRGRRTSRQLRASARVEGTALLRRLDELRASVATNFEDHVLRQLLRLPPDFEICLNAPIHDDGDRVDAIVRGRVRPIFIEVRAQLGAGRGRRLQETLDLMTQVGLQGRATVMPTPPPIIILVVPGEPPSLRRADLAENLGVDLCLVSWDEAADNFISLVVHMANRPEQGQQPTAWASAGRP